jgi:putative peptidoglycan lipid II flippase
VIFTTVASLVSLSILVPFLLESREKGKMKETIDGVFTCFSILIVFVSAVAFFLVPFLLPRLFPGISEISLPEAISLTRILLLSPILLGLSNFFASIVQIYNRFFLYAISPVLYNVGIIIGIVFFYPLWGVAGLGWGVVLGAIMHWVIQIPFIREKGVFPNITFKFDRQAIKKIVMLSIPRTLALSTSTIASLFLVSFASLIGAGSIAVFNFSFNLQSVPLSIIGISYSSAVFPVLSRLALVTRHLIFWSVPVTVLFVVLRAQIVRTILGAGNFSWSDTKLTAAALALFTISVLPQALIALFVRSFYSEGKTARPLLLNFISAVSIVGFGFFGVKAFENYPAFATFFESILKIENVAGSSIVMLALAYSLGTFINMILHWVVVQKEFPAFTGMVSKTLWQSLSSSLCMGYVTYISLGFFDDIFSLSTFWGVFLQGLCAGLVGIVTGVVILHLLKNEELAQVSRTLKKKIWKVETIVPDELV